MRSTPGRTMLNIQQHHHIDGSPILALTGTLDIGSVSQLRGELRRLIEEDHHRVIVDVDGLDYLDSSGLGVLVGALARIREKGGDLPVIVSQARNRRVFDITKLSYVFPLYKDLSEVK